MNTCNQVVHQSPKPFQKFVCFFKIWFYCFQWTGVSKVPMDKRCCKAEPCTFTSSCVCQCQKRWKRNCLAMTQEPKLSSNVLWGIDWNKKIRTASTGTWWLGWKSHNSFSPLGTKIHFLGKKHVTRIMSFLKCTANTHRPTDSHSQIKTCGSYGSLFPFSGS